MIIEETRKTLPPGTRLRLLFQDESRFGRISNRRRCWAPTQQRPIVGQQVIREFVYAVAAVSPEDGRLTSLVMPWVDAEVMSIFLAHAALEFKKDHCLMVLDSAGWHIASELRIPQNVTLSFLPPYSPELNPAEHIWEHLRENYFGNHPYESLDQLEDRLCYSLRILAEQPELVSSLTNFNWLNTLSLTAN